MDIVQIMVSSLSGKRECDWLMRIRRADLLTDEGRILAECLQLENSHTNCDWAKLKDVPGSNVLVMDRSQ